MANIRKKGANRGAGRVGGQNQAARLSARLMGSQAAMRLVARAEDHAKGNDGKIGKRGLDDLMQRAMQSKPGTEDAAALREAIEHVVDVHKLEPEAAAQADTVRALKTCRGKGKMTESDTRQMIQRALDKSGGKLTPEASNAIRYAAWSNGDIMDDGATSLMTGFLQAWYTDQVESGLITEGRKQLEQQLAQDKRDFRDFMVQDSKEHKKVTYEEFKETLDENRIDSSDWQTMMLWLQTGVKRNPITS